jgi:hypothetical protein
MNGVHDSKKICLDDRAPGRRVSIDHLVLVGNSGVRNEKIQAVPPLEHLLDHGFVRVRLTHVRRQAESLAACFTHATDKDIRAIK